MFCRPTLTATLTEYHWVMKLRRMSWAENVARTGEGIGVYMILVERPEENNQLEDLCIDGRIL